MADPKPFGRRYQRKYQRQYATGAPLVPSLRLTMLPARGAAPASQLFGGKVGRAFGTLGQALKDQPGIMLSTLSAYGNTVRRYTSSKKLAVKAPTAKAAAPSAPKSFSTIRRSRVVK